MQTQSKIKRRLSEPVSGPQDVPHDVGAVQGLHLIRVDDDAGMRIWNELMLGEHPRGVGPLVGAQMRYLIGSGHGWLCVFGFSAAAPKMRDRDTWIGWEDASRSTHLHQLTDDFDARLGHRPWLAESFVYTAAYDGACYRGANWVQVGQTQGRGR